MPNPETKPASVQPKPNSSYASLVPIVILASCLVVAALHYQGIINISGFLNPQAENYLNLKYVMHPTTGPKDQNPIVYDMSASAGPVSDKSEEGFNCDGYTIIDADDGEVGEPYKNKMSISVDSGESKSPFRFLEPFDSIAEEAFPPGIKLYPDGTLSGIPTKVGSYEFEACAENTDGDGDCFCVRLFVRSKKVTPVPNPNCSPCPTTSCQTGECCCETKNGIRTSGVLTLDCCARCPGDTHEAGKDFISEVHYKICKCNKC